MEANTYQLKQVLGPERRFVIPTFQRDYEWTRDGQWQLLFEDLDDLAERLSEARANALATGKSITKADKSVAPHFLGAIVCDQLPSAAGGLDMRAVIDGQQRLTTLQLLVRGVLDVLQENASPRVRQVSRLLNNPDDVITSPEQRHKLWPRRKDRDVWPSAMADAIPAKSPNDHLYVQARRYFADKVRGVQNTVDGTDRLDDLVDALLDLFKIVVIDLDDNDDAQIIFEVLNGRQTPLSASDLVKNLLFLRGELSDEAELDELYDRYWAEFDEPWWKERVGTGHAARERRDVLLSVWLTAASGEDASVAHLYGEVRRYLDQANRNTQEILAELNRYGRAYREIYQASNLKLARVAEAYERLVRLNITTAMPLLTWMRTLPPETLSDSDHERAVVAVESWVIRRMIRGANTRGYNAAFLTVLKSAQAVQPANDTIADKVVAALGARPKSLVWPEDIDVVSMFLSDQFYNRLSQDRIRIVLAALDKLLQSENSKNPQGTFDYHNLQIEHIMPQAWRKAWPVDPTAGPDAEEKRDLAIHRIGNLTLVTPNFNSSVSNKSWVVKRTEFLGQTKLEVNTEIADKEDWNEQTIAKRAAMLAVAACKVWPSAEKLTPQP